MVAKREKAREPAGASRALGWSFANTLISKFGTLAIGILLARVLGPEAFGTYAVAFVALMAVLSFNELGVSLAIVRWEGDPREIAPTVTTISVLGSTVFFVGGYLAAPAFASAMGDPEATAVVQLMLVSVLVNGLVATPAALLQREFKQGTRTVIDQVNVWLGAGVSVVLALLGFGAMSLAIGRITGTLVSGAMFVVASPMPLRFGLSREFVGPLLRFGLPLAGSSIIVFVVGYVDQLIAGALLGSVQLGFYVLAFNLASWPVSMFSGPLRAVAPAAFARLQHDRELMAQSFEGVGRVLAAAALPVCAVIAGAAGPIVAFVYGEEWQPAADALRWLAVLAALRILFELSYDFLVVTRNSRSILMIQAVWAVALVPSLLLGAHLGGIGGLAFAQVVVGAALVLPLYLYRLRAMGVTFRAHLLRAAAILALAGVAFAVAAFASALVDSDFLACLAAGLAGLAAMAVGLWLQRGAVSVVKSTWATRTEPLVLNEEPL